MSTPFPSLLGSDRKSRLLIECTYVFSQPWVHSGIQRVVRSIAAHAKHGCGFDEIVFVAIANNQVYRIVELLPSNSLGLGVTAKFFSWLQRARAAASWSLSEGAHHSERRINKTRKASLQICLIGATICTGILRIAGVDPFKGRAVRYTITNDDTLLLLDSSWHDTSLFSTVRCLRGRGLRVLATVYDIIPIRNSKHCAAHLVSVFDAWFGQMLTLADGFICISRTVCSEVQEEVEARVGKQAMGAKAYGWFHLGSELDRKTGNFLMSDSMQRCFDGENGILLVVGTIEPRKNHKVILDAFEQHWASGGESRLCIIGRVGWMCDDVVARMKSHPENGRRLFWFNNAGDDELEFAYQSADALIFASFVEGFGLPLVEGLQRGLPAIASDIPVFREVAGDFAEYFDPNSSSDLCAIIHDFSVTRRLPNARPVADWKWISWKESAQQLFDAVEKCCRELDERKLRENAHQH
jgi:glycosyltransferase involved in cell wall biosynthesis